MSDRLTIQQRHNNMAAIKGKNTKPEVLVRKYLWSHGFRYRLNHPRLPGHPDIVLRKYHTCIFVNGCFWHGHEGCKYFRMPKTNTEFWERKISRNRERDREEQKQLARMGWHCITVWECELKGERREKTLESLEFTLNHIFIQDRDLRYRLPEREDMGMAAEENVNCIDTTGAGDSFAAGFLNALLDGKGVKRCAKEGNRYGAEAVQHIGATAWLNGGL